MKKKTFTLIGCSKTQSQSDNEDVTEEANQNQAYIEIINQTLDKCKKDYPNRDNYGMYGLYDFDQDDIDELFIKVYGRSTSEDCIFAYDYEDNTPVLLGQFDAGHAWISGVNEPNAVLYGYNAQGVSGWILMRYENGDFLSEPLAEYHPEGTSDSEPEEDPLSEMGYEALDIKSYSLDDMSILY